MDKFWKRKQRVNVWIFFAVYGLLMIIVCGSSYCNVSQTGTIKCYPCYYRCKDCLGVGQKECSSCLKQYIFINSTCLSCGDNCYSCKKINQTFNLNQLNIRTYCETCIEGYYLSQSTGQCIKCPVGAQTCTLSAIQTCLDGYYESNGICSPCQHNCMSCSSSTQCQACNNYYFLDYSGSCQSCHIPHCLVCDSSPNCINCEQGFSGADCRQICIQNCGICYSGICFVCKQNFYMSNGVCLPNSLFCKIGPSFGKCNQCVDVLSYLSDTLRCIPFYSVRDGNRIIYLTALNNIGQFWSVLPDKDSNSFDSKPLVFCQPSISIFKSITKNIYVKVKIQPSYKIQFKSQLISQLISFGLSVKNNQQIVSRSTLNLNQSYGKDCYGEQLYLFNYGLEFDLKTDFNSSKDFLVLQFTFEVNEDSSWFGVSEIYLELFRCQIKNCLICRSGYTCQSCIYPFRLQNNQCLRACEEGYYLTESQLTTICTLDCLQGFFAVRQDYTCQKCQWPCVECQDIDKCLRCYHFNGTISSSSINEYYFLFNSICVKQCPPKYFADVQTYTCEQCIFPCSFCSSLNVCNTCRIGYFNSNISKCVLNCPQSQYADFIQLKCKSCQQPCKSCEYSQTQCTQCSNPLYLFQKNSTCLLQCPKDYIQVISDILYCSECQFPCKTCVQNPGNCSSCIKGYLIKNKCTSQCPLTYYKKTTSDLNNICESCQSNCLECLDEFICISCKNQFWYNARQKSCLVECPKGTYYYIDKETNFKIQKKCLPCVPPCLECSNQTYCLSCTGLLFLNHLGQCLLQCPQGTYIYYNTQIQQRQCFQCSQNCISCLSTNNCYECMQGWYLWQGICYSKCPSTTFNNQNGYKYCESCYYPCANCINEYQCSSCISGFLYQQTDLKCVQFCIDGFFEDEYALTCIKCNQQCQTCTENSNNCLTCALGYFFNDQLLKCSIKCPDGTFYSEIQRKCRNCQFPCRTCLSFNTCLSCYQLSYFQSNPTSSNQFSPFILYLGHCVAACPENYFQIKINQSITCKKCEFACQECFLSSKNCKKCRAPSISDIKTAISGNSILQQILCTNKCIDSFYAKNQKCQQCQKPCKSCTSKSYCSQCITGWYLDQGQCNKLCPYHFYPTIIKNISLCGKCQDECKQCVGNAKNCTQCSQNYYLLSISVCVRQCPPQFYPFSKNMNCQPCQIPCLECFSDMNCKTCQSGFVMQETKCVSSCNSKYYLKLVDSDSKLCSPCQQPCQKCKSSFECLTCLPGFYYLDYNFSCLRQCPSQMYGYVQQFVGPLVFNQSFNGLCLQCSQMCYQCSSYSTCISCNKSGQFKYLQQGKCQISCSEGYFLSNISDSFYDYNCYKCKENCISCVSLYTCNRCFSSYLYQNQCLRKCPTRYYSSKSYTCEKCLYPCQECYNQYNCLNCQEGYFLYENICVSQCPSRYWSDIESRQCVIECDENKFLNDQNKTCLKSCQVFYESNFYCSHSCQNPVEKFNFINSTLGCQVCTLENKDVCEEVLQKLKFKVQHIIINGKLLIVFKFGEFMDVNSKYQNSEVERENNVKIEQIFNFSYEKKQSIKQQLSLSLTDSKMQTISYLSGLNAFQNTQMVKNQSIYGLNLGEQQGLVNFKRSTPIKRIDNSSFQIKAFQYQPIQLRRLNNSLWLQISNLPSEIDPFSGYLNSQLQQYLKLLSSQDQKLSQSGVEQNLPFQQINPYRTQLKSFSPQRRVPSWVSEMSEVFSKAISYLILVLVIINLLFDNLKSQFHLIDFTQNIFLVLWISNKLQFGINEFLRGFSTINFIYDFSSNLNDDFFTKVKQLQPPALWNCSLKQMLYGNSCNFNSNFISLSISITIFFLIIGISKILIFLNPFIEKRLKIYHKIVYNHINNFYWLFITPIIFTSLSNSAFKDNFLSQTLKLEHCLIVFCLLLSLILGYQLLKNIFNCSFKEKSFFWGLRCYNTKTIQSNIHFLLLMIRKSILMISLKFTHPNEEKVLIFFFLVVLSNVLVLSNIMANSPFKNKYYQLILIACEAFGILFYLGMEIYIVNLKKFGSQTFIAYNLFLLTSLISTTCLHLIISINETYKIVTKKYIKYKSIGNDVQTQSQSQSACENDQKINKQQLQKIQQKRLQNNEIELDFLGGQLTKIRQQKKFNSEMRGQTNIKSNRNIRAQPKIQLNQQFVNDKEQSSMFSELIIDDNSEQFMEPAKYLIKLEKNPNHNIQ